MDALDDYQKRYAVSEQYRFVYCPIPKVACSSFKLWALQLAQGPEARDALSRMSGAEFHQQFDRTMTLAALEPAQASQILAGESYFKFAIVRNPWDRIASAYLDKFVRNPNPEPYAAQVIRQVHASKGLEHRLRRSITFREFVKYLATLPDERADKHWRSQYRFVEGLQLDFVGRFENLEADYAAIRQRVGCDLDLPIVNSTRYESTLPNDRDYSVMLPRQLRELPGLPGPRQMYTPELVDLVAKRFSEDARRFGYAAPVLAGARPANEILDELYASARKPNAAGGTMDIDFVQSIDRPAAGALYDLVKRVSPARSLEVGMAWGFSTVAIALALRDQHGGTHAAMDPYQREGFGGVGLALVEQYGLSRFVNFHEARSELQLPKFLASWPERSLDFAFIDGDHRVDAVFIDFHYVNRLLLPGGIVVFDDVYFPSIKRVVAYALANFHYRQLDIGIDRFAVLELLAPDDRPWDHYGDF